MATVPISLTEEDYARLDERKMNKKQILQVLGYCNGAASHERQIQRYKQMARLPICFFGNLPKATFMKELDRLKIPYKKSMTKDTLLNLLEEAEQTHFRIIVTPPENSGATSIASTVKKNDTVQQIFDGFINYSVANGYDVSNFKHIYLQEDSEDDSNKTNKPIPFTMKVSELSKLWKTVQSDYIFGNNIIELEIKS